MEIKGQNYKTAYNSSFGYSEDLRILFGSFDQTKSLMLQGRYTLLPYLVGILGSIINIVCMAVIDEDEKKTIYGKYTTLKSSVRVEEKRMDGRGRIRFEVVDELDALCFELHQLAQQLGMGIVLRRDLSEGEQITNALGGD